MNYEGQICRGPMERSSFMLPVEVGCAYNGCKFCTLFKHLKYRELPMEQIEEELKRVSTVGGNPRTVFLGDGNAFGLSTEKLLAIIERVHVHFPGCEGIHMDATVTDISRKSDEDLRRLYEAGVRHLYLGIESGLDDVLAFMNKDHTLEQAYRQIDRMREAGLIYDAHFMTGIAGKGRGIENAEYTAEFFNRTRPSTFAVCNRLGGNLKKVVVDSRDIISDKIEIEMEIQTTVAANKNEINIMCVMPFVIIAMMGTLGQASITANTPLNVLVKLIAIFMFVIAYKLGRKITDIKV